MRKLKRFTLFLVSLLMLVSLFGCGNKQTVGIPDEEKAAVDTGIDRGNADGAQEDDAEVEAAPPKHEYMKGYEDLLLYNRIAEIEQCSSPDELCGILGEIYGEEVTYMELQYEDAKDDFFFQRLALYDVSEVKAPVVSDVYAFFIPYQESPIFMMDDEGAYPVGNYEMKTYDGANCQWVSAWSARDLFLCLHSYAECEGDAEQRRLLVEAVQSMEWYLDYEARALLTLYAQTGNSQVYEQIASGDSRVELLYPVMNGTLRTYIDNMLVEAEKICSVEGPIYNYEALYPYQDSITNYLNTVNAAEDTNDYNDWLLDTYFSDMSWMSLYVDDFITFASQGFTDPRIEEYTAFCYELTDPLKATVTFLEMR